MGGSGLPCFNPWLLWPLPRTSPIRLESILLNLGFNDKIRDAVKAQLDDIWHALEIPTEVRINFLEFILTDYAVLGHIITNISTKQINFSRYH